MTTSNAVKERNADIRAWASEHGHQLGDRGRIPAEVRDEYERLHGGGAPDVTDVGDLDDGGGLGDEDARDIVPLQLVADDGTGAAAETTPRPPAGRAKGKGKGKPGGLRGLLGGGPAKPKTSRARKPRVPVDDVISGGWRLLSKLATPLPALSRTLAVQAPVAGLLLEDAVKGSVVDTVLQPIARLQNQGEAIGALVGPPMMVTAITLHVQRSALAGQDPNPLFMSFATSALRQSLMLWMDVAGPKFEQAMRREKEFEDKHGASVDEFIGWLMSPPPDPSNPGSLMDEETMVRRAQGAA